MNDDDKIKELVDGLIAAEEEKVMSQTHGWSNKASVPRKKKQVRAKKASTLVTGHGNVSIDVLANGYMITVGDHGAQDTYVFPNLQTMTEWLKDNLIPTYKNSNFMEAL